MWITSHSFIFWAKKRAEERIYGTNLGLLSDFYKVHWFKKCDIQWRKFYDTMSYLLGHWPVPQIVILHLTGNDIGHYNTLGFMSQVKLDFLCLHAVLPNTVFIFSKIIPRLCWVISPELKFLDKICKCLNRMLMKFMLFINGFAFRHVELKGGLLGLYRPDKVHLSDIALDIFNLDIQTCVELAVARGVCQSH